jgi:hypothetical protein
MASLFASLRAGNFEWRVLSPYACHARRKATAHIPAEQQPIIMLSLYTLKRNNFLLDFCLVTDEPLGWCATDDLA